MRQADARHKISRLAEKYFDHMAENYPVMCQSDEFYFFPRSKKAADHPGLLESFDKDRIKSSVSYVKKLLLDSENLDRTAKILDDKIDIRLLGESMSTFIRVFGREKIWQTDPTLYLRILLLGTDDLIKSARRKDRDAGQALISRAKRIPRLLKDAKNNLKKVSPAFLETSLEIADSAIKYFKGLAGDFAIPAKNVLCALEDFKKHLKSARPQPGRAGDRALLEDILKDSYSYTRSLDEMLDIAEKEYHATLEELESVSREIGGAKTWQQILADHRLRAKSAAGILALYSGQIEKIKDFLRERSAVSIPKARKIVVKETPPYMIPLRASASYSAPATEDRREPGFFYTTILEPKKGYFNGLHIEYIFVTAHETFPGHHLLDTVRRSLKNPVRQQIESPLFYEGWSSYAERLVDVLGYVKDPVQRLVGLRRQAWRAVRAMLDIGTCAGRLKPEDAANMLRGLGYDSRVADLMVRHYMLTSGYQLCYTIGKFEIDRLYKRFAAKLGMKRFHDYILSCGEIPFDLLEKKLAGL